MVHGICFPARFVLTVVLKTDFIPKNLFSLCPGQGWLHI